MIFNRCFFEIEITKPIVSICIIEMISIIRLEKGKTQSHAEENGVHSMDNELKFWSSITI